MNNGVEQHARTIPLSCLELETLRFIHDKGPVWDGDVPSKSVRDDLLEKGLLSKIAVKGEQGFQAINYRGCDVLYRFQEQLK